MDIRDSSRPSVAPAVATRTLRLTWPGEQLFRTCSSGGMLSSECWRETQSLSNTPNKPTHKIWLQGFSLPCCPPLRPALTPQAAHHTADPCEVEAGISTRAPLPPDWRWERGFLSPSSWPCETHLLSHPYQRPWHGPVQTISSRRETEATTYVGLLLQQHFQPWSMHLRKMR